LGLPSFPIREFLSVGYLSAWLAKPALVTDTLSVTLKRHDESIRDE